jgi:hypothetical protein
VPGIPLARVAVVVLLPAALVLMLGAAMRAFDDPIQRRGEAEAMVWSDRVFTSKSQFTHWLESRGADYVQWTVRHPGVAPWEERRPSDGSLTAAFAGPDDSSESSRFSIGVSGTSLLVGAVSLLGVLLLAASAIPLRLLGRKHPARVAILVNGRRAEVAAAGLSLLAGAGLPVLLT